MLTASLMQHLYITEEDIQRRLKIVGFGDEDRKRVLALSDLIVRQAEDYTKSFFAHLASLDEASGFINNPAAVQTAWQLKREHLMSMVQGTYGPSYVEERLRLGQLYAEAKLAQIADTLNLLRLSFRARNNRKQQRHKNADDSEDNQQLY